MSTDDRSSILVSLAHGVVIAAGNMAIVTQYLADFAVRLVSSLLIGAITTWFVYRFKARLEKKKE